MANDTVGSNLKVPSKLTLKDMSVGTGEPTISDFSPGVEAVAPVVNRPSSVNTAAYAAALSPEGASAQGMIDSYRQALAEDTMEGQSATATQLYSAARQNAMKQNVDPLMDILSNPNITDEQKQKAVGAVYDVNSAIYSPANILSTKAIDTPLVGPANNEQEKIRFSQAGALTEMNAVKQETQRVYNAATSGAQPDLQQHIYDMGQLMVPFATGYVASRVRGDSTGAPVEAFVKTLIGGVGASKRFMRDQIESLPPDQQVYAAQKMADIINTHSNILINTPNDIARRDLLQGIIGGQGYGGKQELADNVGSWLDFVLTGGAIAEGASKALSKFGKAVADGASDAEKAAAFKADFDANYAAAKSTDAPDRLKATDGTDVATKDIVPEPPYSPKNKNSLGQFYRSREVQVYDSSTGVPFRNMPPENVLSNAIRDIVHSRVQPVSLFQNYKDTNVDMARNSFESMTLDTSGEAAQALAGTDRTDAIASAMTPEVVHVDGSVANKVATPDAIAQTRDALPADLTDFIKHDGLTQYLQSEKAAARAWKVQQFQEAIGMTPRQEMFQIMPDLSKFTDTPQGFSMRGVYGPQNNGFSDAQAALETARFALRNTGIDEANLGLLRREGGSYVPTTLEEVAARKSAAEVKFSPAKAGEGTVTASAHSVKGSSFDLSDSPSSLDTSSYGLKDGQWIREVTATSKDGQEMGRLIYTNFDKPPSIRVNPEYQRQGVATAMLKLAKQRGGTLGEDATGKFDNGQVASRTDEGQAFRSSNNPDSVVLTKQGDGTGVMDDYLVTVEHDYRIEPSDITEANGWQPLKVKLNFFDRWTPLGGTQGTFSNVLLDPQSMLDKVIVGPAVVGVDRAAAIEKSLLRVVGDFASSWKGLEKFEQIVGQNEIREANLLSRDYDYTRIASSGGSAELIDSLQKFKRVQDILWHLKNQFFVKMLDKLGYEEFIHAASGTNLPVRKVAKSTVAGGVNVWDAATDTIVNKSAADIDTLYNTNGGIAKLRQPVLTQGGQTGEYVVHTQNPADGYTRKFNSNSQALAYRPGYYAVDYKDSFHIIEKVKDANGKWLYDKSVATANDTQGAKAFTDRMNQQGPSQYYYRKDRRLNDDSHFEDEFDINQAQGMSAFRRRGQLLEDSTSQITNLSNAHVRNPVETMVQQAVSLSKKVALADVIDAIKQRGIAQYADTLPKGEFGQPMIPNDMRKIKYRGGVNQNQSHIADARTTFGYANYLEHSYVNLLDDGIKAMLHNVADIVGKLSPKGEVLTRELASKSLTNGMKSVSYYAFLGLAPLRQLVVQGHQAVMLAALNPAWVASPKAFSQPAYLALRTMGMDANHAFASTLASNAWGSSVDAERVFQQFQRTGLSAAIDHQNMISGAVNDMAANMVANARNSLVSKATYIPRTVAGISRKIGFDAGEFYSSSMSWLAHRDLAEKQGLNVLNDDVADKVSAAARNYTGNMNTGGDMATNKNLLAMVFQYTQNTQKMILNMTANRAIPLELKIKMALLSVALFGVGTRALLGNNTLNSVQDPNGRELISNGLEGWMLNKMMSLSTGQKSVIDWGGLSPFNAYGTLDLVHSIFTTNIGEIIANSPSLSMFFGNNPRVSTAVKDFARYTHLIDDYQDPTTFLTVAQDFAKISSGYSAGFKAMYLLKTRQKVNGAGNVTQDHLDQVNAIGTLLGMPTLDETTMMIVNKNNIDNKKEVEADFNNWYKDMKAHYGDPNLSGTDLEHTQKMLTEFFRVYGNNNSTLQRLMNQKLVEDLKDGDATLYNTVMRNCPLYNKGDCLNLIDSIPFNDPQEKQNLKDLLIFGNQFQDKPYDGKDN